MRETWNSRCTVEIQTGHLSDSDKERCHLNQVSVATATLKYVLKRTKDLKTECVVYIC